MKMYKTLLSGGNCVRAEEQIKREGYERVNFSFNFVGNIRRNIQKRT